MTFAHELQSAEDHLQQLRRSYLQRFGWEETCHTPGAYWLWKRDMTDQDRKFDAWHAANPDRSPHKPYGVMTVPMDLALSITMKCIDEQKELGEDDEP